MKRIIKSRIFTFILGAIIFGSVGVIAANYVANDISFTPKDTTWKKQDGTDIVTVKDALDELYTKIDSKLSLDNVYYEKSYGPATSRTISKQLEKGKYIVSIVYSEGGSWNIDNYDSDISFNTLQCLSNKCEIDKIVGKTINATSSGNASGSSYKAFSSLRHTLYHIDLYADDTISVSYGSNNVTVANTLSMEIVKLN